MRQQRITGLLCALALSFGARVAVAEDAATYRSHPPIRPLAMPSKRPMNNGPAYYVDPTKGHDRNKGSQAEPFKTLGRAVKTLKAGDTLYLRGGTYYEHVIVTVKGTAKKPITIRGYPGELATIDGGYREFYETPGSAWQPCPDGAQGEYQSVKTYPELATRGAVRVMGNFADSMVPLHGYRFVEDLRSSNEYFSQLTGEKGTAGSGIYCGPGVYSDPKTGRIHIRLAHTTQKALGNKNYRGERDPRKLRLVIAGSAYGSPLAVAGSQFLKVQDVVVRGSRSATVSISKSTNIHFEGATVYGGSAAFGVNSTAGLRLWNCACRGVAAPWTYRGSLKYRSIEARIFAASGWNPGVIVNRDFELAYSEFTDCVDGVFLGNVKNVKFHHNLLDNVSDDGLFLTATTGYDGKTPGGNVHVYQNLLRRCLTVFAFGVGHGRQKMTPTGRQTGAGVFIYRNVFDFRKPVHCSQPAEGDAEMHSFGRVAGDHGGPLWEPMTIYHNTIVSANSPYRGYYAAEWGGHMGGGSKRWVFNNAIVHVEGTPGSLLPPVVPRPDPIALAKKAKLAKAKKPTPKEAALAKLLDDDLNKKKKRKRAAFAAGTNPKAIAKLKKSLIRKPRPVHSIEFHADGNLHWSYAKRPPEDLFAKFQQSPEFKSSKQIYRPGWTVHDIVADPAFTRFRSRGDDAFNLTLKPGSPAINAGVAISREWSDPLSAADRGKPDIGALPAGAKPWRIGVGGRLNVFGVNASTVASITTSPAKFLVPAANIVTPVTRRPAAIIQGYPARDDRLLGFALRRRDVPISYFTKAWLETAKYQEYALVAIVGNLARAKIEPRVYTSEDLRRLESFLKSGGTLLLSRGTTTVFDSAHGRRFLANWLGTSKGVAAPYQIVQPKHRWVKHLDPKQPHTWMSRGTPLRVEHGEIILGTKSGLATLYRRKIGKGRFIYVGWEISASLPHGRRVSTVEQEIAYEEQMQILTAIVNDLDPKN